MSSFTSRVSMRQRAGGTGRRVLRQHEGVGESEGFRVRGFSVQLLFS